MEMVVDKPEDLLESTDDSEMGVEKTSTIIGTMSFKMDDQKLNTYLKNVLDWWHGRRPPKGVGIELTRRCLYNKTGRRLRILRYAEDNTCTNLSKASLHAILRLSMSF